MRIELKKRGYTLVELLMYTALLGLVMSFIALIFRHMLWRDRLEKYLDDHLRLKTAFDMVCDSVRNSAEVIKPASGTLTSKLIILKNDGTYEKIGMYTVNNSPAFISRSARTLEELESDVDYEKAERIFSRYVKKFYVARPFYNHVLLKASTDNNSAVTALNLDSVKVPRLVNFHKDFYREYRGEFTRDNYIISVSDKMRSNYSNDRRALCDAMLSAKNIRDFTAAFDRGSKSTNILRSKARLKEFISESGANEIGRILFFTAYLIEKSSVEISLANTRKRLVVADNDITGTPEDIFGPEIISGYESASRLIAAKSRAGVIIKPDYKTMLYEMGRVCDYNKTALMTQMGIATPYTGSILDDRGNAVNIINLHFGKTVPLAVSDIDIFSDIEAAPPFNSPDKAFSSIYQIIDSKLPYLGVNKTFSENLDALMYASKNIKKVTVYSNKIDIYDHRIKFPLRVIFNGRGYDLAFFIRQAADMALTELPDMSKSIPIPISAK